MHKILETTYSHIKSYWKRYVLIGLLGMTIAGCGVSDMPQAATNTPDPTLTAATASAVVSPTRTPWVCPTPFPKEMYPTLEATFTRNGGSFNPMSCSPGSMQTIEPGTTPTNNPLVPDR